MLYCLSLPYNSVTLVAGHYKETKNAAYIEAALNIILSIVLVQFLGLIGVVIATTIAVFYRAVDFALYISRNILERSIWVFIQRQLISFFNIGLIAIIIRWLFPTIDIFSYQMFFIYGVIFVIIASFTTLLLNSIFYPNELKQLVIKIRGVRK